MLTMTYTYHPDDRPDSHRYYLPLSISKITLSGLPFDNPRGSFPLSSSGRSPPAQTTLHHSAATGSSCDPRDQASFHPPQHRRQLANWGCRSASRRADASDAQLVGQSSSPGQTSANCSVAARLWLRSLISPSARLSAPASLVGRLEQTRPG